MLDKWGGKNVLCWRTCPFSGLCTVCSDLERRPVLIISKVIVTRRENNLILPLTCSSRVTNGFSQDSRRRSNVSSIFLQMLQLGFVMFSVLLKNSLDSGLMWCGTVNCISSTFFLYKKYKTIITIIKKGREEGSAHLFQSLQVVMVYSCLTVEYPPVHRSFVVVDTSLFWVWWWW